jgi:hypothetical protein
MNWKEYFEMMIEWKKLPAYRAEPRIDSLIGYYLDSILKDFLKIEIKGIIPEFPLRIGTLKPAMKDNNSGDRSYKVDFLAIGGNGINYLVEFKTDTSSIREKQSNYLDKAKEVGMATLVEGVLSIVKTSAFKDKYNQLKKRMQELQILGENMLYTVRNSHIEIIYIQPSKDNRASLKTNVNINI